MTDRDLIAEARELLAPAAIGPGVDVPNARLFEWAADNLGTLLDGFEAVGRERDDAQMELADLRVETETNYVRISTRQRSYQAQLDAYRNAMRDVRRILTDFGITNPPPRLAAVLEGLDT